MPQMELLQKLRETLQGISAEEGLAYLGQHHAVDSIFSTSFGIEDQAISHLVFSAGHPIDVFTLDTGRMFVETYSTWRQTLEKYSKPIHAYYPEATPLQEYVTKHGPNAFYETVELRKSCCHIRKVEPLKRALKGKKIWITGLRAEQSANRQQMNKVEWDEGNQIIKYHPILDWTWGQLKDFIRDNQVPYNVLHDKGFVSIGCAPCTRAIREGEDFRAGRWWWEDNSKKECGLHTK
jgi:phosphoadenosine phosphosulfate reductase